MEEMYISLNRTITKLADTSRKAEEKVSYKIGLCLLECGIQVILKSF